jgi:ketosteroid isomerase-like protein
MDENQSAEKIRKLSLDLDKALENKNVEFVLSSFSDDCEIELLGIKLVGKAGVKTWLDWMYRHLAEVRFTPITIMVEGNVFFEEFLLRGKFHDGKGVESRQAEALIYERDKLKVLRLYFDRLDFSGSVAKGPIARAFVRWAKKKSLIGLTC